MKKKDLEQMGWMGDKSDGYGGVTLNWRGDKDQKHPTIMLR